MRFHRRERIDFRCSLKIEEIQVNYSEKRGKKYAKIISVEGACLFCYEETRFRPLIEKLQDYEGTITLEGSVSQNKGGTFLVVEKIYLKDLAGSWVRVDDPPIPDTMEEPNYDYNYDVSG